MSLTQTIDLIRQHTDTEGRALLDGLHKGLRSFDHMYAISALDYCLNEAPVSDAQRLADAPALVDDLEESLQNNYTPLEAQRRAHKKDMLRWFEYMRAFLDAGRLDGAREIMTFAEPMFAIGGKQICGSVRSRCSNANDGTCMHKFALGEYVCPACDTPRSLCKKSPMDNGRCGRQGIVRGHGGNNPTGALHPTYVDGRNGLGRGQIFAKGLEGRANLQQMYIEALQDEDYLSLMPEIALLTARRGQLLEELDAIDPDELESKIAGYVSRLRDAVTDKRPARAVDYAGRILEILETGGEDRARWRELVHISGQMARLADVERKRIVEAKRAVPISDVLRLRDETIKAMRVAITSGSEEVHRDIMLAAEKGRLDKLQPDHIKRTMLRYMANQVKPEAPEIE